jgi:hypothetical protein
VHLTAVHGQLKSLVNLGHNTNVTIVETENPDIVKRSNLDISFQTHIRAVIRNYGQSLMNDWVNIMKNIPLTSIPKNLKDDHSNVTNGYSFATDPANSLIMKDLTGLFKHHNSFPVEPDSKMLPEFFRQVHQFTLRLSILMHMSVGIPPRATETCSILISNSALLGIFTCG